MTQSQPEYSLDSQGQLRAIRFTKKMQHSYFDNFAGKGFGLQGGQRGAPESMAVIRDPTKKIKGHLLAIRSNSRQDQTFNACRQTNMIEDYAAQDIEEQDDLWSMTGTSTWAVFEEPLFYLHVYFPDGASMTALRTSVIDTSYKAHSYPGIFLEEHGIKVRLIGGHTFSDAFYNYRFLGISPDEVYDRWWTLAMRIHINGNINYYATNQWVDKITAEHRLGDSFALATMNQQTIKKVIGSHDILLDFSQVNASPNPTLIHDAGVFLTKKICFKYFLDKNMV